MLNCPPNSVYPNRAALFPPTGGSIEALKIKSAHKQTRWLTPGVILIGVRTEWIFGLPVHVWASRSVVSSGWHPWWAHWLWRYQITPCGTPATNICSSSPHQTQQLIVTFIFGILRGGGGCLPVLWPFLPSSSAIRLVWKLLCNIMLQLWYFTLSLWFLVLTKAFYSSSQSFPATNCKAKVLMSVYYLLCNDNLLQLRQTCKASVLTSQQRWLWFQSLLLCIVVLLVPPVIFAFCMFTTLKWLKSFQFEMIIY